MPPRRTSLRSNLLTAFITISVLLVGSEVLLRLTYEAPWYERLISEQMDEGTAMRRGLRRPPAPDDTSGTARRILILGDSFTYGQGIDDPALTFPGLLESRFEVPTRVFNAGVSGSMTSHWVGLAEELLPVLDPDLVLVVFSLRDGTRTSTMGGFFGPIRDEIAERNRASNLYRASYLYRLYRDPRDRADVAQRYTRTLLDAYFGDPAETEEWRRAQANLDRIFSAARARSASRGRPVAVGLVVFPILVDLGDDYPFAPICVELGRVGDDLDVPTLDLLPAFQGRNGPDLWVSPYDQHPNETAHGIAAAAIEPFVHSLLGAERP